MNQTLQNCSKCFVSGAKIKQFSFVTQGDAFRHYQLLLRHGRLPMLCQTDDARFRVCDELASSPSVSEQAMLGIA
jgi:hypothetical protein